ncbi:MAG: STAS domain-containing protein [Planctomycetota bacterium]
MQLQRERRGAVTVVTPEGPLTELDVDQFKGEALQQLEESLGRFVVDLSRVPFVDSRGLEVLLDLTEEMGGTGQSLKLCGVQETLRQVLDLTDLAPMFEYYEDAGAAARSFL